MVDLRPGVQPGDGSSDWQEVDLLTYEEATPRVAAVIGEWRERVAALRAAGDADRADALSRRLRALEEMQAEMQDEINEALEAGG